MTILPMKTVVVMCSESLVTQPTVIRFLSCVNSLVVDQNCFLGEFFPAECTLLLLDTRARLLMSCEVVVGPEIFTTNIAGKLVVGFMSQHVLVQAPFPPPGKLFATNFTF